MADKRTTQSAIILYCPAHQQVPGDRQFPKEVRTCHRLSVTKKEQPRRQPAEELSSSLKPTISVETSEKSRSDAVAEVPRRS